VAAVGAALTVRAGEITAAGIGLAAVGGEITCAEAQTLLVGGPPTDERLQQAARAAAASARPVSDQRGSAEYKRHVTGVLTARALRRAATRAVKDGECR
jgi:carbon-monoxide dehydrogenase medium subunit